MAVRGQANSFSQEVYRLCFSTPCTSHTLSPQVLGFFSCSVQETFFWETPHACWEISSLVLGMIFGLAQNSPHSIFYLQEGV